MTNQNNTNNDTEQGCIKKTLYGIGGIISYGLMTAPIITVAAYFGSAAGIRTGEMINEGKLKQPSVESVQENPSNIKPVSQKTLDSLTEKESTFELGF